ncbi:unnamed protein product [Dibothriocephalus latus]|uniref:alkaline phosphatase n=1 Tax=Dibothriocephalus latus TaxID=60516 RepID=A0A3P7KWD9_DIBLA|nr:unnamed protein product [Dibothriocephalus latus]
MNGPGAKINQPREDLNTVDDATLQDNDYQQQALVPLPWSTHGGEDVGIYAHGPFSWLFHRTVDNTFIAHAMKYAMCVEPYTKEEHCNGHTSLQTSWVLMLALLTHILIEYLH